nr:MAG TPA: tail completion protein [Caudoviricetes sp.]
MESSTRSRTPLFFQKALVNEIKEITKEMIFHAPKRTEMIPIEVFPQSLPIPVLNNADDVINEDSSNLNYQSDQIEDPVFKCPWCVVKIEGGSIPGINEQQTIQVAICFGIFNNNVNNQGHLELLNLFQKVYERFAIDPILDGQFTCAGEFDWALQDEDTYPYYFGAITTSFKFMGYRRENKFL